MTPYSIQPNQTIQGRHKKVSCFDGLPEGSANISEAVVKSFGDEWKKFHDFDKAEIARAAAEYFDILENGILTKDTYLLDAGCGSGRWSMYLADKVGFIEAIDPSDAIFAADEVLRDNANVRLSKASIDQIPFHDETFDVAVSIGVLHHIPDTRKAVRDCIKKVKKGGHFYTYMYYNLDNRNILFRSLFQVSAVVRKLVSSLPAGPKKITCDTLAIVAYMPLILTGRLIKNLGFKKLADKIPLSYYHNKSFYIIRNDSLDRFGTKLEQRFTKAELIEMLEHAGLSEIVVSPGTPYWHAVGKRIS